MSRSISRKFLTLFLTVALVFTLSPAAFFMQADEANAETSSVADDIKAPRIDDGVTTWDCVYFGSYPQTEIVDKPETSGAYNKKWSIDSDYIVDSELYTELGNATYDANGDTFIGGVKYRRIVKGDATNTGTTGDYYTWSDDSTFHYFRYDKIKWRVLEKEGKYAMLLADKALDDQIYNSNSSTWDNCAIRKWLNGDEKVYKSESFINAAFSFDERNAIQDTTLANDNSITYPSISGGETTVDKIFLLSERDMWSDKGKAALHGFEQDGSKEDNARKSKSTTFAKAMGVHSETTVAAQTGNCYCWLRSPGKSTAYVAIIHNNGTVVPINTNQYGYGIKAAYVATRPALYLNLTSDLYSLAGTVSSDGGSTVAKRTVSFDVQGHGTAPASITVDDGSKITKESITDPTADGFDFDGWYKDAGLRNKWDFDNDIVTEDITLYAKWDANELKEDVSELKEQVTQLQTDLDAAEDKITALEGTVYGTTEVTGLVDRMGNAESKLEELKEKIEKLKESTAENSEDIDALEQSVETMQLQITSIYVSLNQVLQKAMDYTDEKAKALQDELNKKIDALNSDIEGLKKENEELKNKVDELQNYIEKVEFRGKTTDVVSIKACKKTVKVKAKAVKGAEGYEVYCKEKTKGAERLIRSGENITLKVTGLKSRHRYAVKVRAFKYIGGKLVYTKWSSAMSVRTK